jgi:hypothetical protein
LIGLSGHVTLGAKGQSIVEWKLINSQDDLDNFLKTVSWDDVEIVEIYAYDAIFENFPSGATAPGVGNKNVRVLINDCDQSDIELVFDHAEKFGISFSNHVELSGKVDTLGRIECSFSSIPGDIKAERLRYRYLDGEGGKAFYLGKGQF